jgi:hypothetical protein
VLVTIDGAGASHAIINHLSGLNTAAVHGRRGRRVEYSIGWPVDERTQASIDQLREHGWGVAVAADGRVDPKAAVADLTGILRKPSTDSDAECGPASAQIEGAPPALTSGSSRGLSVFPTAAVPRGDTRSPLPGAARARPPWVHHRRADTEIPNS